MDLVWIIILLLAIYIPLITVISLLCALLGFRKGKAYAKKRFRDIFLHFFFQLLNPLNWFS